MHEVSATPIARRAQEFAPSTAPPRLNDDTNLSQQQAFNLEIVRMGMDVRISASKDISGLGTSLATSLATNLGDKLLENADAGIAKLSEYLVDDKQQ